MEDAKLKAMLDFDPLAAAEAVTGASYKEDPFTMMKGLAFQVASAEQTEKALWEIGDSCFSMSTEDYKKVIEAEGFELVLAIPFTSTRWEPADEMLYVYWHADGILLVWDTYHGRRNSGHFYYNWKPNGRDVGRVTSSGRYHRDANDLVWAGDHDCREAIRFNIRQLRENGQFVKPWQFPCHLWLINYEDTYQLEKTEWPEKSKAFDRLKLERFEMLPEHVRAAIKIE